MHCSTEELAAAAVRCDTHEPTLHPLAPPLGLQPPPPPPPPPLLVLLVLPTPGKIDVTNGGKLKESVSLSGVGTFPAVPLLPARIDPSDRSRLTLRAACAAEGSSPAQWTMCVAH